MNITIKGGQGSGNHGHAGRPGSRGGSAGDSSVAAESAARRAPIMPRNVGTIRGSLAENPADVRARRQGREMTDIEADRAHRAEQNARIASGQTTAEQEFRPTGYNLQGQPARMTFHPTTPEELGRAAQQDIDRQRATQRVEGAYRGRDYRRLGKHNTAPSKKDVMISL